MGRNSSLPWHSEVMVSNRWRIDGIEPDLIYKKSKDPMSGAVETSIHMRERLASSGKPVIVSFSRGKDSICAMIALLAAGVEVIPVHLYRVPGLKFEEDSLKYFEDFFQMRIFNLPHRDFWYYLDRGVFQAPWQISINQSAELGVIGHDDLWDAFKEWQGLPKDTWLCDGIRCADSIQRRVSIQKHSPWTDSIARSNGRAFAKRYAHVVHDWKIKDIRRCLEINKVKLPVDYELFGRTFDGLDYRFVRPLRDKLPDDYDQVLKYFPAVEMEFMRYEFVQV